MTSLICIWYLISNNDIQLLKKCFTIVGLSGDKSPPKSSSSDTPSSKRVSFGPYISPEYIDKNMPPSTPVRKGQAPPINAGEGATPKGTPKNPANPSTPSALLRQSMKKKIARQPSNVSTISLSLTCKYQIHFYSGPPLFTNSPM